ncbi:MAG: response regulator [Eubacteriales bacterium]|jgi:two-component system chemotaxis response regulator CheY|nr:response regulator [Clostridiales bacterium]
MARIMIVDDAAFMRITIKNMLKRSSHEVVGEAENGIVAIERFKELRPDIVTMDITMPEMDGITALREIVKIDPNANVIMVSAMGQEAMVRESILSGAKGFIVKPFKEEGIISALDKLA